MKETSNLLRKEDSRPGERIIVQAPPNRPIKVPRSTCAVQALDMVLQALHIWEGLGSVVAVGLAAVHRLLSPARELTELEQLQEAQLLV